MSRKKRQDRVLFIAFTVGLVFSFFTVDNKSIKDVLWLLLLIRVSYWAVLE